MISIEATKNNLKVRAAEQLTSGSVHVYPVKFTFNSDWDGLTKTAVFKAGSRAISVVLDNTGECTIPWEVLTEWRYVLYVGIYGTKEDTVVLPTIWAALGTIREGTQPGDNAQEPTPSVYQQLIEQLDAGRSAAQAAADRAEDAADRAEGAASGGGSGGGAGGGEAPTIGANGNWYIGGVDTGVEATGPQGEQGLQGLQGEPGPQGLQGEPGADGSTPQRGVDYWTDEDQQAVVDAVLAALPNGNEVEY